MDTTLDRVLYRAVEFLVNCKCPCACGWRHRLRNAVDVHCNHPRIRQRIDYDASNIVDAGSNPAAGSNVAQAETVQAPV